jgi:hypothetical protein
MWTPDGIKVLVMGRNEAVERAMVAIWDRQTADEKSADATKHDNGVGFSGSTVRRGSYYAKWVKSGRRLSGSHLERARHIALRHLRQLTNIANKKI